MKIGVISSYACVKELNNYGALFQYYALQKYLKKRGHYAYWIRSIIPHSKLRLFLRQIKNYRNVKLICKYYRCHRQFMQFINTKLHLSLNEYEGNDALHINCPEADFYITGSDQVWGGTLKENYLQFVKENRQKIAYAVSFGKDHIDEDQANIVRDWVRQIPHISVREKSGIKICKELIGPDYKVEHLLDPTLLIDAHDYLTPHKNPKNNLLNCYFLNISSKNDIEITNIESFAKNEHLITKISSCQYSEKYFINYDSLMPSPSEWLQNYYDSKYVITNTFHGTVFAIIFEKPFITILQKGSTASQNERMVSLLQMLDLEDRMTDQISENFGDLMKQPINWKNIKGIINQKKIETDVYFSKIGL